MEEYKCGNISCTKAATHEAFPSNAMGRVWTVCCAEHAEGFRAIDPKCVFELNDEARAELKRQNYRRTVCN